MKSLDTGRLHPLGCSLALLLVALTLSACNYPVETTTPAPTCSAEDLAAPTLTSPGDGDTVNASLPILEWSWPSECVPEGYRIDLSTDPSFADTSLSGGTGNPSTSWAPGSQLADCMRYHWRVAGIVGTTLGPFSGSRTFQTDITGACADLAEPPTATEEPAEAPPEATEPPPEATEAPVETSPPEDSTFCTLANMVPPTLVSPANGSTTADNWPSLTWTYADTGCVPQSYAIDLSTDSGFADTSLSGGTGTPSTSWAAGAPLDYGTWYYWRVAVWSGTVVGPWSTSWSFRTPDEGCPLLVPTLSWPANGATVTESWPSLHWTWPSQCLPQGYRIDLSTDPSFADTSLSGGTGNPSTQWAPGAPLTDGTQYYWRVAGINGTTLGPFSATWSFVTDFSGGQPPAECLCQCNMTRYPPVCTDCNGETCSQGPP
jgi:hypothetical protein